MSENDDYKVTSKPKPESKVEAGRRMVAEYNNRMENFVLPEGTVKKSQRMGAEGHCVECEFQPMCQHPYAGWCKCGQQHQILDYMCMCVDCAVKQNRCAGCGKLVQ
eukprot:NODE_7508_length_761_cov_89.893417_g7264_i0.p1 GENE.NODE_7508_length_761_cov_89.893417_g7264_i0~~NODE_7508_length_761_cov_89.893417_g7264_i0.p1  ORF type:complete len:106 (-),score=13.65 NODE_7508_length_761_cov_89.893417_g7264_i0:87-404(-)